MISKSTLALVVKSQLNEFNDVKSTVRRTAIQKVLSYSGASALVVKGVRRCGKSTLMKQIIQENFPNAFFYFNFDDDRIIGFTTEDFQALVEVFIENLGPRKNVFFDEIQNIKGWELFVNRLLNEKYHVFITGSNANLLSQELGTHMTGRHVDIELYPFSFTEFLIAQKIEIPKKGFYSTEEKALLSKKFKEYLSRGGMPEAIVFSNEAILTQVLTDIIQKDIVTRYKIRKTAELKSILNFLISNFANPITYTSIKNNFKELKTVNTIQKYISYAEETYLVFTIKKFEKKAKQFDKNPKKIYCIDNGIITRNTPITIERNAGLLENAVAIHLKRLGKEFYYYKGKTERETDFLIPKDKQAIQVCYEFNENNNEREIRGLLEAMKELKTNSGLILTLDQEQEIKHKEGNITVKPAWEWMLEKIVYPDFEEIEEFRQDIERALQKSNPKSLATILNTIFAKSSQKELFQNKSFRETIFKILERVDIFTPDLAKILLMLINVQLSRAKEIKDELTKYKEVLFYWVKPRGPSFQSKAIGLRLLLVVGNIEGFKQVILDEENEDILQITYTLHTSDIKNQISKEELNNLKKWVSEKMEEGGDNSYNQRFHELYKVLNR